jgi:hypothetical protein
LPWGDVTVPQYLFTVVVKEVVMVPLVELLKDPVAEYVSSAVKKVLPATLLSSQLGKSVEGAGGAGGGPC